MTEAGKTPETPRWEKVGRRTKDPARRAVVMANEKGLIYGPMSDEAADAIMELYEATVVAKDSFAEMASRMTRRAIEQGQREQGAAIAQQQRIAHLEGELRVVTTQHQIARDVAADMSLKLTAVEGALREAEAKAARAQLALNHIVESPPELARAIASGALHALQQPKAGAS